MFDYIYADFVLFLNVYLNSFCGLLISSTDSNDCFTKQDAMKQAEVLGIAERTMERWLLKLVQSADIERIGQGIYKKVALKNASA